MAEEEEDVLDDIFRQLEIANQLESTGRNRVEAATKYYEAVYLMRRYIQRLPMEASSDATRQLLTDKIVHYVGIAQALMTDDESSAAASPHSPMDKIDESSIEVLPSAPPPPPAASPRRTESDYINSRANLANNKLSTALDLDEASQTAEAIAMYMEAAGLFLEAIKRAEEMGSTDAIAEVMKRRLESALDRVQELREAQPGKRTVVEQQRTQQQSKRPSISIDDGSRALTAEEIAVLKRSSLIASGLFLPWSDDDATQLSVEARSPTSLFRDKDGFLPLSSRQTKRFHKWARPTEIVKMRMDSGLIRSPQTIVAVRTITPYTIRQQYVTDCSFIASLCICSSFERRFKKQLVTSLLYPQSEYGLPIYNRAGKYMVKLWLNGVARCVVIDDMLPVDKYGNLLCSETTGTTSAYLELWVCLIEKAYMKLCGGYDFPGSNSGVDLFSLTGWIPERVLFAQNASNVRDFETHPERAWERIYSASSYGDCLITISTDRGLAEEEIEASGLVTGHAYAVLSVIQTKNGTRLLQLKNPWAHQSWKGRFSSQDYASWSDVSLCAEVGYNPKLAAKQDDGVFWICWADVLKYFQNFHLSWDPSLFSYRVTAHGFWPKDQGPVDDTFNIGENPQYVLSLSERAINCKATIWILLSRHVNKQEQEGAEAKDFLTVHIHRNNSKKRKLWYPGKGGGCILTGAYTNNPHVLVRYDVMGPQDAFLTLVLSQYKKSNDLAYTLSCFSTEPFTLGKPAKDLEHSIKLASGWTAEQSGGPLGTKSSMDNPMFAVAVPKDGAMMQLQVSTSRLSAVNVVLVPVSTYGQRADQATGPPVVDSGKYRHGFVMSERLKILGGAYAMLVTNFDKGKVDSFRLVVTSSVRVKVQEIKK